MPVTQQQEHDRKATPREVEAARRFVFGYGGIGVREAARRLGFKSQGYVSEMFQGKTARKFMLSDLRRLREASQ